MSRLARGALVAVGVTVAALAVLILAMGLLTGTEPPHGSEAGLLPCPESPNCVSSLAPPDDSVHRIEPLRFDGSPEDAWADLKAILEATPRIRLVAMSDTYLRAEARTRIFRFVDDVEFLLAPADRLIHVRSASRLGYGDLGVNRGRIERIRRSFSGR